MSNMIVKAISIPQFIDVDIIGGTMKYYIPRGPKRTFLVSLSNKQLKKVAHHNIVMNTTSPVALAACFTWGLISLTNLTPKILEVQYHGS